MGGPPNTQRYEITAKEHKRIAEKRGGMLATVKKKKVVASPASKKLAHLHGGKKNLLGKNSDTPKRNKKSMVPEGKRQPAGAR